MNYEVALSNYGHTSNRNLVGPQKLTYEQWLSMPVPEEELDNRAKIEWLQKTVIENFSSQDIQLGIDQLVPVHIFHRGIYTRQLTMPTGHFIIGRRHNQEHYVRMTEGRCLCFTEHGFEEMNAPYEFYSPAGEKRVLLILERTTWQTIHFTDLTDAAEIQTALTFPEQDELLLNNKLRIGAET